MQGLLGLGLTSGLTSCLGSFEVFHLNQALPYDAVDSKEDIKRINFAHLNAADLRGNTPNILKIISAEEALQHAQWLADYLRKEKADIIGLNEIDYAGTAKTGGMNQPKLVAKLMHEPYDYVLFDQYMKSPLWTTGNAVISRYPMKAVHRHLYGEAGEHFDSRLDHFFKDFIHVEIKIGKKKLDLVYTHLDDGEKEFAFRKKEENQELREYLRQLVNANPRRYIVLAGDFNYSHDDLLMKRLLSDGIVHPPSSNFGLKTYQNGHPTRDLDHILASGNIAIHNYQTFEFPWSDHLGLMCELEFLN